VDYNWYNGGADLMNQLLQPDLLRMKMHDKMVHKTVLKAAEKHGTTFNNYFPRKYRA
jgi:hypothetical protein